MKMNKTIFFTLLLISIPSILLGDENRSKSILLVIDMQKDLLTPGKSGMKMDSIEIDLLLQNVNKNISIADSLSIPVAYIQNVWTNPLWIFFGGNVCRKGDKETDFDKRLIRINSKVYEKSVPNSFSNRELEEFIEKNNYKNIFICGIKIEACVGSTAKNSLKKGYNTYLIGPAIGTNTISELSSRINKIVKMGAKNINEIKEYDTP